ncbi:N-alpha-acetyltransferase 40-like [Hylaeus volcanicus]|uniref:N-alpha-acetyltransferase 40-like n=1 Tax=Hylaeus volcanicus TaxID=313075 RepID=UPI0023B7F1DA|nr:N-alpha-acetyltransferase 40-like [Hylaeus volcanicus]
MSEIQEMKLLTCRVKKNGKEKFERTKRKSTFFRQHSLPLELITFLNKHELNIHVCKGNILDNSRLSTCLELCSNNMKEIYDAANFQSVTSNIKGWSMDGKKKELCHRHAFIFLLLKKNTNSFVQGFLHFRFEKQNIPILYLYDIQFDKSLQAQGLGRMFMLYLEKIAKEKKLQKIICTVQTNNEKAVNFYKNICGYTVDPSSPVSLDNSSTRGYEILSKTVHY